MSTTVLLVRPEGPIATGAATGWLRPARPGEGPGLVWEHAFAPFQAVPPMFEPAGAPLPAPEPGLPALVPEPAAAAGPAMPFASDDPGPFPTELLREGPTPLPPEAWNGGGDTPRPFPWAEQPLPPPPVSAEPLFPAPALAGGPAAEIATPEGSEGIVHQPGVTGRPAEGLGWRIAGGADAALLLMDPASGALRFLASPDFEQPGDTDGDNRYELVIEVRDGWGASATQLLTLRVTDVADAVWG